jgi:hypothetical protein
MVSLRALTPALRYRLIASLTLKWTVDGSSTSVLRFAW